MGTTKMTPELLTLILSAGGSLTVKVPVLCLTIPAMAAMARSTVVRNLCMAFTSKLWSFTATLIM